MEGSIPGEIVNPRGGFEEDHWLARERRGLTCHAACHLGDAQVVPVADEATFETLGVEVA